MISLEPTSGSTAEPQTLARPDLAPKRFISKMGKGGSQEEEGSEAKEPRRGFLIETALFKAWHISKDL